MAAVTRLDGVSIRGTRPGEGRAIAGLWRELWDAHEAWGGYAASRDSRVYEDLAGRLDEDARVRASHPVLGRHVHLVAAVGGALAGQVEGWFERHGIDTATPFTCEVRSLIVTARLRRSGAGRVLLDALAATALGLARGSTVVLAAEVLEPNPAFSFYERVRYAPVSWVTRIGADRAAPLAPHAGSPYIARIAEPRDALAVAVLESSLAARRRSLSDVRFDRPRAVDATFVSAIAAHLGAPPRGPLDALEIVAADRHGSVRASASFAVGSLDAPFVPSRRAVMGRFAVDPALDPQPLLLPMVALGCRLAKERAAPHIELTDLTPPGSPIYKATLAAGALPWSRIYTKLASP
jgi:GNAT superfamily N-acetyltransferase